MNTAAFNWVGHKSYAVPGELLESWRNEDGSAHTSLLPAGLVDTLSSPRAAIAATPAMRPQRTNWHQARIDPKAASIF